ncbi:MAG: hypothetical protein LLG37_06370 [Spirochaetia bacterium]|nr:hypothetical protein [Spirochaetia bacterium]
MVNDRETVRKFLQEDNVNEFKKVKNYLNKNPMASVMDVSNATGVMPSSILGFVNAGILKIRKK